MCLIIYLYISNVYQRIAKVQVIVLSNHEMFVSLDHLFLCKYKGSIFILYTSSALLALFGFLLHIIHIIHIESVPEFNQTLMM